MHIGQKIKDTLRKYGKQERKENDLEGDPDKSGKWVFRMY
jgi:hypothetical protein